MFEVPFTANARALGSRQADAVQRITASFDLRRMANGDSLVGNAGTFGAMAFAATGGGVSTTMDLATSAATLGDNRISLDSGRVARSANETRGVNIAYHPRIHA